MRCTEFLASYSDYRDGLAADPSRLAEHARSCERCGRHDRALRIGVDLLRRDEMDLSHQARVQLRVRLALAGRPIRTNPGRSLLAASAMVIVALAWGTVGTPQVKAPSPTEAAGPPPLPVQARGQTVPALAVPAGYLKTDSRNPPPARVYQGTYQPVTFRNAMAVDP